MKEIAPGVLVEFDYEGANCGLILTGKGAIVVDTPMIPEEAKDWVAQVAKITDNVLYVFNTDHHRAHILGNQYFSAPVLAHESAWKEMSSYKDTFIERTKSLFKKQPHIQEQFSETRIVKPELTFTGQLIIKKGGRELRFMHLGGHTPATSGLYLPDVNILFTGDLLVVDEHPALGQCSSKEWLTKLAWLKQQTYQAIVPGHGPLCNVEAVEPVRCYIRTMRAKVRSQYKQGRSKAESAVVISQMIDMFPFKPNRKSMIEKRIRAGVSRIYDEMKVFYGHESVKGKGKGSKKSAANVPQPENNEPPTDEQTPNEQAIIEQPVEEQPVEEQAVEEQAVEEQAVEEQPVEEQAVEEQPVEEQAVEEQAVEEQPVEEQAVEEQAVEEQAVEEQTPASDKPQPKLALNKITK